MYLTKGEFLQKFGILPQEFEEADISWEELLEIADDYERRRPTLEKIRKEFVAEFLQDKEKEIGLQSYHSRLKVWKIMQNTGKWMRQTTCVM